MADTALTLITDTLLDMGVIANSAQPTAAQTQQALRKLNNMLESWAVEGLLVYGRTANIMPLVANQQVYTIGSGGNLNIAYPDTITGTYVRNTSLPTSQQLDYPVYRFTDDEWAEVALKGMTSTFPNWGVWYNTTYPLVSAYVLPVPTSGLYSLIIWTEDNFGTYTANTVLSLKAGYRKAITANLYLELAPSYSMQVDEQARQNATSSKLVIQRDNIQINELSPKMDSFNQYDIYNNRILSGTS